MSAATGTSEVFSKVTTMEEALAPVKDGSVVMIGGFGDAGTPFAMREALAARQVRDLTLVANNADFGSFMYDGGLTGLVCSFPVGPSSGPVKQGIEDGVVDLQLTPQGTLAERIRAAGAGLGGVLTPTGLDMEFAADYRVVEHDGRRWLLAPALHADVALVKGAVADRYGNVVCRSAGINFNPLMAMAASYTVVQVDRVVEVGEINPQDVTIPSLFVDAVVEVPRQEES
ncbi:CoA transferase subunit A [Nocardioides sp. LHG3406-4]|uniref:CoA transferase subunit A n=1 Tax=Nocardioides sp. LHG3406-4 TaxID=2804575 RepID=UPI003CFA2EE9